LIGQLEAERRVEAVLARLRFHPNYKLWVHSDYPRLAAGSAAIRGGCPVQLTVQMRTLDSHCWQLDAPPVVLVARRQEIWVDDRTTDREIVQEIRAELSLVGEHEIDEWLRLDGELLHDPHPERSRPA
jgi:hypothetical protein